MIPDNSIGAEGMKALAPALGRLSQLKEFYLESELTALGLSSE